MREMLLSDIAEAVGGKIIRGSGDIKVSNVKLDSGECEQGSLFVPIVGERRDAHDFLKDAASHGAVAAFASRDELDTEASFGIIRVEDTRAALQRLGRSYREKMKVPIVGITGSVGKTTTKEMVAAALGAGLKVIKTKANWNSQVGLPRMMLEITEDLDAAVIEMGMSLPHEMERLAFVAAPQCAIITNIGVSHIGNLGSREAIRREKLSIINGFTEGGYLLVNGDDELLALKGDEEMYEATREAFARASIENYGLGENCDYRAVDIREENGQTVFDFVMKRDYDSLSGDYKARTQVRLNTLGTAHVMNAIASIAMAVRFGLAPATAAKGLLSYAPEGMRGETMVKNGITIINDAYNASPDSVKSGLDILMKTKAARHIAVLADMLELGDMSEKCHRSIGSMVAGSGADILIAVGKEAAYTAQTAEAENSGLKVLHFDNNSSAAKALKDIIREEDAVLFKGSRGMKLEEIIHEIC